MQHFDEVTLNVLKDSLGDAFALIAEEFIKDSQETITLLQQAAQQGDRESVNRHSHSLKSSAGYFGAAAVQKLAAQIEHDTKIQLGNVDDSITQLAQHVNDAVLELQQSLLGGV